MQQVVTGPYDDGYSACDYFWGKKPAAYVQCAARLLRGIDDARVLDLGCGDGKNSSYLASLGMSVLAVDMSRIAIDNARRQWTITGGKIDWKVADMRTFAMTESTYDLIVSTGSLHCLKSIDEAIAVVHKIQNGTKVNGLNVIYAFNDGEQDLTGHQESFRPLLLPHNTYTQLYSGWDLLEVTDLVQEDSHPHTRVIHRHSITRLFARKR